MSNSLKTTDKQQTTATSNDEQVTLKKPTGLESNEPEHFSGSTNPYQSPDAPLQHSELTQVPPNQSKWYQLKGRIGRLRYMAYQMLMMVLMYAVLMVAVWVLIRYLDTSALNDASSILTWVLLMYIPLLPFIFYSAIVYPRRRLHDLNQSGWWLLLMFVPLANVLLTGYLIFARGEAGANQYGAPPRPNRTIHYIAAFSVPVLAIIIGILAAIAIPAYDDYLERAQQQVIVDLEQ